MILARIVAGIWQQSDINALKAACASGVLMVTYAGPPQRSVTYQSLPEMRKLLAEMVREVSGPARFRRVGTRKGFRDGDPNDH